METTLHRQLKELYAGRNAETEVRWKSYRIDAVRDDVLIEIQHSSLGALRRKAADVLPDRRLLVVKPIVVRKVVATRPRKGAAVARRRYSPKRGRSSDLFEDLVHFTQVFPHPNLCLEAPLVEIEETRRPARRRRAGYIVENQTLLRVVSTFRLHVASDLRTLLLASSSAPALPCPFSTAHLAASFDLPRWQAQRAAYCLRQTGAAEQVGKSSRSLLYAWSLDEPAPCLSVWPSAAAFPSLDSDPAADSDSADGVKTLENPPRGRASGACPRPA